MGSSLPPRSQDPVRKVRRSDLARLSASDLEKIARDSARALRDFGRGLQEDGFIVPKHLLEEPPLEALIGEASNIRAWLFNESRRAKETVVDFSAAASSRTEILDWVRRMKFNRNTFDLSVVTHARASQRSQVWEILQSKESGPEAQRIVAVGPILPKTAEGSITATGRLAPWLYRPIPIHEWLRASREANSGRNSLSLIFSLGLHHNDPHQLLPIPAGRLLAFTSVLQRARSDLLARLRRRDER